MYVYNYYLYSSMYIVLFYGTVAGYSESRELKRSARRKRIILGEKHNFFITRNQHFLGSDGFVSRVDVT